MTERDIHLKNFVKNKEQFEAVRDFILESCNAQNWLPNVPLSLPDAEYARRVKSTVKARVLLESAFDDMERLSDEQKPKESINQSR